MKIRYLITSSLHEFSAQSSKLETYTMPKWSRTNRQLVQNAPTEKPTLKTTFESKD